jgi:uncharacterized protein
MGNKMKKIILVIVTIFLIPLFALNTNKVILDYVHIIHFDPKTEENYLKFNNELLKRYDIDFVVLTTANDKDINIFANKTFNVLSKFTRSKSGKMLLLIINVKQDKVRLEVAQALEPVYTDAFVSYVERKGMVPYFRSNKISDGVFMMMELVYDRAVEASKGHEWVEPMKTRSIGGGAKTKAFINKKDPNAKKGANVYAGDNDTPKTVFEKYIQVLKTHNKNPNLDIYTDSTKKFFSKWTVTDINQNNELRFINKCKDRQKVLYDPSHTHAVLAVLPYDKYRTCSPYFFKKEQGKWKLDIATMAQVIRFNTDMMWHFDNSKRFSGDAIYYAYAFEGYYIGKKGFVYTVPKKYIKKTKHPRWKYTCQGYYHPKDKKRVIQCYIRYATPGGPANVRLGFIGGEKIYSIGEGKTQIKKVDGMRFVNYLDNIPSGKKVTIVIEHFYINGKETYNFNALRNPNLQIRYETREAIAP